MSRLTFTRGMESSDPFTRAAQKLYRMRAESPCTFEWPSRDAEDEGHVHHCAKHSGHGITHKCPCGATRNDPKNAGRLGLSRR